MEQMVILAVLFLLSEAVGVPEGLQAAFLACQHSLLGQELPGLFAVEPKTSNFFLVVLPWDRHTGNTGRICSVTAQSILNQGSYLGFFAVLWFVFPSLNEAFFFQWEIVCTHF